ncbi:endonuclease/exonuclease/phosphatase family protein [Pseudomonas japonica]|uniref:Metal-dependent hydrolase, endonuclease/exonuclease/phosphatase family n=1 Tax=Pseudomonas japonica TaxID=256466 RepID=A0A239E6Q4_9PSED|nr:endonuclease/exonuclease/phosphatase family protein [Pseudomonas japonica]SNS40119.1 Metal-dependent hydrolase, endonuclease/exonuclease/phosphatase family [Pseudomonas japonica]
MTRLLRNALLLLLLIAVLLWLLAWQAGWRPEPLEEVPVACTGPAKPLVPGQQLKVMTWNLQYLAGKRYVFWYDEAAGEDTRPTEEDLAFNLDEVARVIRAEQADIVLLQELDKGAKASDYQDQLALLRERLADLYPCAVQAWDWKAEFVPDRHIAGSVGRTLATLSRYPIQQAQRVQLPRASDNVLSRLLEPQQAVLVSYLPLREGGQLAVLNTQLARHLPGNDVQPRQVRELETLLDRFERQGTPWIAGGDFNQLPLGQYRRLKPEQRRFYAPDSELHRLWDKYPMIPANAEATGAYRQQWLTHFPNDPRLDAPDRTLDYLFHSPKLRRVAAGVVQQDTLAISDHLPVLARLLLPTPPES